MQGDEARALLGFSPNSRPTLSQVKAAYRRKVWESHPDLFPAQEKRRAESKFKLISEAYSCLLSVLKKAIQLGILKKIRKSTEYSGECQRRFAFGLNCQRRSFIIIISASMQIPDFVSAKDDFGTDLAISTRKELDPGARREGSASATNARVVRTGVPRAQGGRGNPALIRVPFLFLILGTVALGGLNAARAYKKEKEAYPSHHPFLP